MTTTMTLQMRLPLPPTRSVALTKPAEANSPSLAPARPAKIPPSVSLLARTQSQPTQTHTGYRSQTQHIPLAPPPIPKLAPEQANDLKAPRSRSEIALSLAIEMKRRFGLAKRDTARLSLVFKRHGLHRSRAAIEDMLAQDISVDTIRAASTIRCMWKADARYHAEGRGTHQVSILPWRSALKLLNAFEGLPCDEEVQDLLGALFATWEASSRLRKDHINFLCYLNGVLKTRDAASVFASSPLMGDDFGPLHLWLDGDGYCSYHERRGRYHTGIIDAGSYATMDTLDTYNVSTRTTVRGA